MSDPWREEGNREGDEAEGEGEGEGWASLVECPLCEQPFFAVGTLKIHIRIYHDADPAEVLTDETDE